jgi:hypothetical protein
VRRGNRSDRRGHRPRTDYRLRGRHKDAAAALALIAWGRLGRPATDDEAEDVLAALVLEERDRVLGGQDSE